MALGLTQLITEMRTRNLSGGTKRPARRADNLAAVSPMSENVGTSTSRNPKDLHGLYRDNFTFTPLHSQKDVMKNSRKFSPPADIFP
jgi:hypothetical protein